MLYHLKITHTEQDTEGYFLPNVETKDYNILIDAQTFFDRSIKNDLRTYDKIRKISTAQRDDHATGCLLDYL